MRLLKGAAPAPAVVTPIKRRIKHLDSKHDYRLDRRDATKWQGIPTTTVARTLVDLAALLSEFELGQAWHQARVLYRTEPEDVEAVLARRPNSRGAAELRAILRGKPISLSKLERGFLELLKANDLELPETNKVYGGRYVDCRWERDRKRERQTRARGDDFRRYTSDDVFEDPRALLRELSPIIGSPRRRRPPRPAPARP